jgi:folate-binding protein YgfZ
MVDALRQQQRQQGGVFDQAPVPQSFGNDGLALAAAAAGCALVDRSHWGVLSLTGGDRHRFLHNQTTQSFNQRPPGTGADTVFVTATARTLDLVTAYVTEVALILLTSPGQDEALMVWMDRYIFPADQVRLENLSGQTLAFTLVGPTSGAVLAQLGVDPQPTAMDGDHRLVQATVGECRLAVGTGLGLPGYTLLAPAAIAAPLWTQLCQAGAVPAGEQVWDQWRVQQGRPAPEKELGADYNPLEAGLWQTISFDKGCYIGQETIARLNTYQGVKQQLWGLRLSAPVACGSPLTLAGERVGVVTSVVDGPEGAIGLGYVRTKAGGAGLVVQADDATVQLIDCPFLSRGYLTPIQEDASQ